MPPHQPLWGPSSSRCSVKLHCKNVERKQGRLCLKPVFLIQGPHWGNLTPDQQSYVKPLSEQGLYRWTLASIWCVQWRVALVREWSALCSRPAHESTRLNAIRIAAFIYVVVLLKISDFLLNDKVIWWTKKWEISLLNEDIHRWEVWNRVTLYPNLHCYANTATRKGFSNKNQKYKAYVTAKLNTQ